MTAPPLMNQPRVLAEVREAFEHYEAALRANDVETLNAFFLDSPATVRFGLAEHAYGIEAIRAYRRRAAPIGPGRALQHTVITTFGSHFASVATEFTSADTSLIGRQTQAWVLTAAGWKIASAHVSSVAREALRRD